MNLVIEKFQQNFLRIKDHGTERSFYPALTNFLQELAISEKLKDIFATAEESAKAVAGGVGFPDITVRRKDWLVGWIEVKLPEDSLDNPKFNKQFEKYKDALENILFTNFKQWELWQWGDEGKPVKIKEIIFDVSSFSSGEEQNLIDIFHHFFSGKAYEARTTKQLALALAKKTKLLSNQVEEAFKEADETSDLVKLKEAFEKTLIQNIEPHQFANMVAETVAYSLFLASLEHTKRGKSDVLTLTTAMDYLPASVPILADLYSLIKKVSQVIPNIHQATTALIDQLNVAEMAKIELKLREHKVGEDPVIHFYEPFLNEYDPKEREARGVYYTPKPVVDYIVRSVDFILKEKFGKQKGLADESVNLLDPATGTGTFLMSAIQQIHVSVQKQNNTLGQEMVIKEFNRVVVDHILKHFYGFELLVAPYAIAHLKLTLLLEDLGFNFEMTKDDGDKDNDRLKVYLANTLDDPNKPPQALFGFNSIAQESEAARKVKKDVPILAIIGNPPYSVSSSNKGEWIEGLMKTYKAAVKSEQNIQPLSDDYIKFIRFAHWKIQETGKGLVAFITNNSFIGGLIHRGMRDELSKTFDNIYILNLHGHSAVKENAEDQNIFNIRQGVSVLFLIKTSSDFEKCRIYYADLMGSRASKFDFLLGNSLETTKWQEINNKGNLNFFVPKEYDADYESYFSIRNIFELQRNNPMTGVDDLLIDSDRDKLIEKVKKIFNREYDNLLEDSQAGKIILKKMASTVFDEKNIFRINYRPLNFKYIYFEPKFLWRSVPEITNQFLNKDNLALVTSRVTKVSNYCNIICSHLICDYKLGEFSRGSYSFPLYFYPIAESKQNALIGTTTQRKPNLSQEFIKIFSDKIGLEFDPNLQQKIQRENEESMRDEKAGNGKKYVERWNQVARRKNEGKQSINVRPSDFYFGPEDVFYYAYGIFHSPTYRSRYGEQLKIDFPRLPLTSNKQLFANLVAKGNELVNLHLLGENPFDRSKTIFDETGKWGVSLGGEKPENLEDWKVSEVKYSAKDQRVYVNPSQYFEGVEKEVWEFMIGGYQVCEKWLKDRKKTERRLSLDDLKHYMKIVVSLRETIRIMKEIDQLIPIWPMQ